MKMNMTRTPPTKMVFYASLALGVIALILSPFYLTVAFLAAMTAWGVMTLGVCRKGF